ncbi:hypothetical protein L218DRAFT_668519 [Marasmius fiardii PR-910]|nr:hypothetical protein L218DRAFT_668519 [Marasmius fiardii PR-910]
MSQNEPPSNHLASLTLDPSNTVSKESHPGSSTQSASVMEYASEEENAQFHKEFPNVPKGERLVVRINDRWQSLYVSEKHVYCSYFDKKLDLHGQHDRCLYTMEHIHGGHFQAPTYNTAYAICFFS